MTFVRTVLGDIDPARTRGHRTPTSTSSSTAGARSRCTPDFDLGDVDRMVGRGGRRRRGFGLQAVVDAMPCDCGRNVVKLAELSRRAGIHIIAPDRLHHARYYAGRPLERPVVDRRAGRAVHPRHHRRHRCERLRRADHPPHRPPGRGHQDRRERQDGPSAARPADLRGRRRGAPPDRRPDPDPLRGRDGRARAGPAARGPRRRPDACRPQPRRQGRRPGLPPASCSGPGPSPSTTARSAGATAENGTLTLLGWALEDDLARWDPAGHGRGPPGLLPRVRRAARARLAARRVHARDGRPRSSTRDPAAALRRQPRAGVSRSRSIATGAADERPVASPAGPISPRRAARRPAHERRRLARAAVVVRGRDRRRRARASSDRPTSRRCSTTRSTSRSATRSRPGSRSSPTARCAGPASSRPSSTST